MKSYKVLESKNHIGLTVGSRVILEDEVFSESDWKYGNDALQTAIENKRCVEIKEKEEKKKDNK